MWNLLKLLWIGSMIKSNTLTTNVHCQIWYIPCFTYKIFNHRKFEEILITRKSSGDKEHLSPWCHWQELLEYFQSWNLCFAVCLFVVVFTNLVYFINYFSLIITPYYSTYWKYKWNLFSHIKAYETIDPLNLQIKWKTPN